VRRVRVALLGALLVAALAIPATTSAAAGDMVFYGAFSGEAEVPAVETEATGSIYVIVNAARTKLTYVATFRGLSGPVVASHLHVGATGEAGPVVLPLNSGRSPMIATKYAANVTPAGGVEDFGDLVDAMRSGRIYANLHTAANPPGEIRAQLRFMSGDRVYSGALSGAAENPPVATDGTGSAYAILNAAETRLTYFVTYRGLSGPVVAAHIHLAPVGSNGPIIIPLKAGPSAMVGSLYAADVTPAGGVDNLSEAFDAIRAGDTYVNLHTSANPGGEVRAQLR
jgi:hypothetical protein